MFTAMLAAGFTSFISDKNESPEGLMKRLNSQFISLGKGERHSTFTLAHIPKNSNEIGFYGAGCTPLVRISSGPEGTEVKSISFKSDVIGLFEDFQIEKSLLRKKIGISTLSFQMA